MASIKDKIIDIINDKMRFYLTEMDHRGGVEGLATEIEVNPQNTVRTTQKLIKAFKTYLTNFGQKEDLMKIAEQIKEEAV